MESKKYNKLVATTKKQIHRYRGETSGYQWGEEREEGNFKDRVSRDTNYYV